MAVKPVLLALSVCASQSRYHVAADGNARGLHVEAAPPPAGGQIIPFNAEQSLVFAEGENFTAVAGSSWEPREWAKSPHYFASTVANVFHSRRAYLHGPQNATGPTEGAATSVTIPAAGEYTVLVRYEMPYRFEVPFSVTVSQGATKKFTRVYGRRSNLKVWGFAAGRAHGSLCGPGLQTECCWPWYAPPNTLRAACGLPNKPRCCACWFARVHSSGVQRRTWSGKEPAWRPPST